jgi:hypothetical protein
MKSTTRKKQLSELTIVLLSIMTMLSFLISSSFQSCDVIEAPYKKTIDTTDTGNKDTVVKKVFLEEFTGSACTNCPDGHRSAKTFKNLYKEKLIIMSIHAGSFAEQDPPKYPYDFTTTAGENMNNTFKVSLYPCAMINRKKTNGSWVIGEKNWGSVIVNELASVPTVKLEVVPTFNSADESLSVSIKSTFLANSSSNHWIAYYIVEDSVTAPQLDNGVLIKDYLHRDMLRSAPLGAFGERLNTTAVTKGQVIEKTYSFSQFETGTDYPNDWRLDRMKIIAVVHKNAPDYDVVQVEEVPMIK